MTRMIERYEDIAQEVPLQLDQSVRDELNFRADRYRSQADEDSTIRAFRDAWGPSAFTVKQTGGETFTQEWETTRFIGHLGLI